MIEPIIDCRLKKCRVFTTKWVIIANLTNPAEYIKSLDLLGRLRKLDKLRVSKEGGKGGDHEIEGNVDLSANAQTNMFLLFLKIELKLFQVNSIRSEQLFLKACELIVFFLNLFHQYKVFLLVFGPLFWKQAGVYLIILFLDLLPQPKSLVNIQTLKMFLHGVTNLHEMVGLSSVQLSLTLILVRG